MLKETQDVSNPLNLSYQVHTPINFSTTYLRPATQLKARARELASGACITKLIIGYHLTCNTGSSNCKPQLSNLLPWSG